MNKNCEIVRDLFPSYLDNICSVESNNFIEQHIKSCETCKEILNTMKTEIDLTDEVDKIERLKAKKPFKKIRNIIIILVVSIVLLTVLLIGQNIYQKYIQGSIAINTSEVIIKEIEILDKSLVISGDTTNSKLFYAGYVIGPNGGDTLYFTPNYSYSRLNHPTGEFKIAIKPKDLDFSKVNQIYLQGQSTEDVKLIWKRNGK